MSNIADRLKKTSEKLPEKTALIFPKKFLGVSSVQTLSFQELYQRVLRYEKGFKQSGISAGMRVLVFVKPGLRLAPTTFALFKMGAIPVFIDPGMGKKNLLSCIEKAQPEAMIGEPIVHVIRKSAEKSFASVKISIKTKGVLPLGMKSLQDFEKLALSENDRTETAKVLATDLAAILFTSGGTGIPKGVPYTHKIFNTQTDLLQEMFDLNENECDCPGFPLFSMFTLTMGMTSVIPDFNASKPAKCNPKKIVQNIIDHKATFVAGSPAIWERVANYCLKNRIKLLNVKYVVMFGAPVSLKIHEKFQSILPQGTTYTPYGATESLPVALTSGEVILARYKAKMEEGKGTYLGKVSRGCELKIIPISDQVVESITPLKPFEVGEIIVSGDMVTQSYDQLEDETALAKIYEKDKIWHRMGDLGFLDQQGDLWFCGRKSHRVITEQGVLTSIQCEAVFNNHPSIKRSALIGLPQGGHQKPALVVELNQGSRPEKKQKARLLRELKYIADQYTHTSLIKDFYFSKGFPVDVRHNIKIDRLKLRDQIERGKSV